MPPDIAAALVPILREHPDIDVGVLFGSMATGRTRPDSDVDLYVRLRGGTRWALRQELALAAAACRACGREVDLIVESPDTSVILRREVAAKGRLLYEAEPGAWVDLRATAVLAYVDLEPYMRRIGTAVRAAVKRRG